MTAAKFDSTQWSLVMTAQHRSSPEGRAAFARLCEKYWYPLYAHVRRREQDVHRAQDLTQGFFEKVVEKNYIADADPNRGRFRTFLLASMAHFIANESAKERTIKRGGDRLHFSLQLDQAERQYCDEPTDDQTAETVYERRWAIALLQQVLDQLHTEHKTVGKADVFLELQQFLTPHDSATYVDAGRRLGISEGAVKAAVHRLRTRYRDVLRREIAETVSDRNDVDDEIRALFETFST